MSDQFSYYYPRDLGIFRTWGQTSTMGILGIWEICQFFNGPFPLHWKIFQMQFSILIFIKDLGISYCGVSVVAKKAKSNLCEQWKVSLIRLACYFEPLNLRHLRIAIWERCQKWIKIVGDIMYCTWTWQARTLHSTIPKLFWWEILTVHLNAFGPPSWWYHEVLLQYHQKI